MDKKLLDEKLSHCAEVATKTTQQYHECLQKNNRGVTKKMKRKPIMHTDASPGKITYSSLKNEHLLLVKIEVEACEIPYQEDAKIRE